MKWIWPNIWAGERGGWWRVGITLALVVTGTLVGALMIQAVVAAGLNETMKLKPLYAQQMVRQMASMLTSGLALAGCLLGIRLVHRKPVACVFTDGRRFNLPFAFRSASLWVLLWFASAGLLAGRWDALARRFGELPASGLAMLAVAVCCATSVQGTLEEVVFRGYLQPRLGTWVKRTWLAVGIVGVVFAAIHWDSWTPPAMIYVAGFSLVFGVAGVRAGTLAPLCSLHLAENAMHWLWFPNESNGVTTWSVAGAKLVALSGWLAWLFWSTRTPTTS